MKSLKMYLEDVIVTPANTMGMGNPELPAPKQIGKELKAITKKNKKKQKEDYL